MSYRKIGGANVQLTDVMRRLEAAHTIWITTAGPRGPHAAPVWFVWAANRIVFATGRDTHKARDIAFDSRVRLHLDSGDDVVLLSGVAERIPDNDLPPLDRAYGDKYVEPVLGLRAPLLSEDNNLAYAVRPRAINAWLYGNIASRTDWALEDL
jgi:hypothetical protein